MNTAINRMAQIVAGACTLLLASALAACMLFSEPESPQDRSGDGYAAESSAGSEGYPYVEGVDWNTEEYGAIRETGFISTRANPLSTLSADVDTASYANLRRMIFSGCRLDDIPAGAVRIEEMLNYFTYDYAQPAAGERFAITTHLGPCPWNPQAQLLTLGFSTADEPAAAARGRNLVFLIDVSGSMADRDKLDLLKDSFEVLVNELDANDRISLVTYADGEELVLEGAPGNDESTILRALDRLQAGGSTNGERGLELAYETAERNFIEGGVNRIIMASDGDLNVGMTSESDLYDYVQAKRETGIYLSVLGFGAGNFKDNKMETLADNGNGSYHYIDCIDEAERVFAHNLSANLVPFADDVKVQVEFNPAVVKGYRLIGYENREMADEDFLNDEKDAADVGPGAQFTVCYEVILADSDFEIPVPDLQYSTPSATDAVHAGELATATLRYRAFDDGAVHEQSTSISTEESIDGDWYFAAAVVEFGMYLRNSEYLGTTTPESISDLIARSPSSADRDGFAYMVDYLFDSGTDVLYTGMSDDA